MSQGEGNNPLIEARAAWERKEIFAAAAHIEAALALELKGALLAHVRITAGVVYRELGDTAQAITHLLALMEGWDNYPEVRPVLEGYAWYNLALAYRQRYDYVHAVEAYRKAIHEFVREGMRRLELQSRHNLAWVHCLCEDPDKADEQLTKAESIVREKEERWHQRLGWARVCLTRGYAVETVQHIEALRRDLNEDLPAEVLSQAYVLSGCAALLAGFFDEAEQCANMAQRFAVECKEPRLMNDACKLRRDAMQAKATRGQGA